MNPHRRFLVTGLLAATALPSLAADRSVKGSGRVGNEKRSVGGFDRLSIAGAFDVELHQGESEGVELSGDDNLLGLIETRVEGKTLHIAPQRGVRLQASRTLVVRVALIQLVGVELAGSVALTSAGLRTPRLALELAGASEAGFASLQTERLAVSIGGSGKVRADGRAAALSLSIAGSGDCSMPQLVTDDVAIDIAGSGAATVQANRQLSIAIAGSGRVRHSGAAVPVLRIAGSGDVKRLWNDRPCGRWAGRPAGFDRTSL